MGVFKDLVDEKERNAILDELSLLDPKWSEKLKKLVDRYEKLTTEGNFYGEVYTSRQWDIALTPIFNREMVRVKILRFMKDKAEPLSVRQISEALGIPGKVVLFSIVELTRRRVVEMSRVDGTTPLYRYAGG